jgi:hypothetical protein
MKHLALFLLLFTAATGASAQLRAIPEDAKRGGIRHLQGMLVEIDGTARELAPGAQIRDASNFIIVPVAVPSGAPVKYIAGEDGRILRVWILTPQEASQRDQR